ncbi:glycosyltransferase [Aestuariibaculum sp. M13]|uniref:glycosyltransferase n=1 Tax=Aestuariibaculum sp. M13 TaxID=2967132 RepID=UPI002159F962|nr:glycosyltransferase [Aestuariibaculum sp. M13]MCR8666352.1 glycosyltransferase [Aestuariibaculum sp. M13]
MKIGLVLALAPGYSETFFRTKIKGLQESGHKVVLFCNSDKVGFDLCEIQSFPKRDSLVLLQVGRLILEYISLLPFANRVIRFIREEREHKITWRAIFKRIYQNSPILRSDLDWLHFGFGTLALGRESLGKAIGANTAVSFRGFDISIYPLKNPGCYTRLWQYVDKVHVISEDIKQLIYDNGFSNEAPVVKITPAINIDLFCENEISTYLEYPIKLVTVSRLHWIKGLVYILEALAILKLQGLKFQYTIIGEGPELERLKYITHQLKLEDEVVFFGKFEHSEVKNYLRKSDIYVQYSLHEGFCNAVLEAQAIGLLCVVSDAGGLSENVLNGITGWVVPKGDSICLAKAINNVITLPEDTLYAIKKVARNRIQKDFNVTNQNDAFLAFYNQNLKKI